MILDEIGLKFGTDKSSKTHDYLRFYERRLGHLRGSSFNLFEVGVFKGASLRTWCEFFPEAVIVGLDVNSECQIYESGNGHVRIGDASSSNFLFDVLHEFGKPTIVVDDGSHRWDHQIITLQTLFPILLPGGIYIIEDIDTSFETHLATAKFEGTSSISTFDYITKLARFVCGENALGSEAPHDLFIQDNYRSVGSIEIGRRTVVLSKRAASDAGGPR